MGAVNCSNCSCNDEGNEINKLKSSLPMKSQSTM